MVKSNVASPAQTESSFDSNREQRLLQILATAVVRPSFQRCCAHGDEFFDAFYSGLATRLPGVGAMFAHTDMRKQNALVREGIATLIAYAEHAEGKAQELERLGRMHGRARLNIEPGMYTAWVDNLMDVVGEYDPQLTVAIERAWREVLVGGIEIMISHY